MDRRVLDSQQDHMEMVPDSQMQSSDEDLHARNIEVAVLAVIGIISSLMIMITNDQSEEDRADIYPRPIRQPREPVPEDGFNLSRWMMEHWRHFMETSLIVFRVFNMDLETRPMRRIEGPWYIKPRTIEWFYLYIDWSPTRDSERFRQFFRISPAMFVHICDLVRPDLISHAPVSFHSLPNRHLIVERQVVVAIRRLSTGDSLLGIGELFGLSKTIASRVTWKFCQSFSHRARHHLKWPRGPSMEEVKAGFQQRWGFPNCCGAIDVTHFIIELPPGENFAAYYDWKHNLSISMQAVVDNQCRFLDVIIGTHGSVQDSHVLRTSYLYHNVVYDRTKLNGPDYIVPGGYRLREYLLGDAGYPLYNWLIVPFNRGVSDANDRWNQQHSAARMCVERSFGKLKGMWRLLSRVIFRPKLDRLPDTILTCVLLHNMMLDQGEEVPAQVWNDAPAHPEGYATRNRRNQEMFDGGQEMRDALQLAMEIWSP